MWYILYEEMLSERVVGWEIERERERRGVFFLLYSLNGSKNETDRHTHTHIHIYTHEWGKNTVFCSQEFVASLDTYPFCIRLSLFSLYPLLRTRRAAIHFRQLCLPQILRSRREEKKKPHSGKTSSFVDFVELCEQSNLWTLWHTHTQHTITRTQNYGL